MKLCMGCMESIEDRVTTCPYCGYDETTLRQESYYLAPGTIVGGKYIVGRVLGYGGYTITYLGMDAELNRKIIVKEYLPSDFSTRSEGEKEVTIYSGDALEQFEQGLTTFLNEANRIQHLENIPGITKVYDCVAENDTGYVISEYLKGHTLKEVLDSGRSFTPQETKNFISQILEGLRLVHPLDVIHCDIAPETIMITDTGEIKLLDFGATRYVTTANSKSLAIILKQGYAPEEQYRSRGNRGPWTDVYALAAVMYRMITGLVPDESVDRALADELKEPSKLGIQIPKNMENALMNALNVYQKDRTPSAEVFLNELNSPEVKRIQVKKQKYETGKFPRWAKGLVAGLLCLVIVGGIAVYKLNGSDVKQADIKDKEMIKIMGCTESEAKEELRSKLGLDLVEKKQDYRYCEDSDWDRESEILTQEPAWGDKIMGKTEVKCTIKTSEKCRYSDIKKYGNVNKLAEYLNIKSDKLKKATGKDCDDEDKTYYDLYSIKFGSGKEIRSEDLKDSEKEEEIILIEAIEEITYYVSPFLYVESLGDYRKKNVEDGEVQFYKYEYDDNKEEKQVQPKKKGKPTAYKPLYISLSPERDYREGCIVEQLISKGKEYNSVEMKETLFHTVGDVVDWNEEMKGAELKQRLINNYGIKEENIEFLGEGSEGTIDQVKAEGAGARMGGVVYSKKEKNNIKIIITTKPIPTQVPQSSTRPTVTNQPSKRGNSSGGPKAKRPVDGI